MSDITPFEAATTAIDDLLVLTMKQVHEPRGAVRELYRASAFAEIGLAGLGPFQQINATETRRGGLRGLHAEAITKLVAVVHGEALGAYVDLRAGSATIGQVVTVRLVPGVQVLVLTPTRELAMQVNDATRQYGRNLRDLRTATVLAGHAYDDAWTDLVRDGDGLSWLLLGRPDGTTVAMWADGAARAWQVCTGDDVEAIRRTAVAAEPMTCVADAFRTGDDLVDLAPGASHTLTWGLSLR